MTLSADAISLANRLDAVSASFGPGQITAICGPNGAGKSTLLSILSGLLQPDCGLATLHGKALSEFSSGARAQHIGYLPQNGEAAWDVAVRNLVALGRMPHGDSAAGPVEAALKALDLEVLAARPISELSGGEKARAFLARVLAGEPEWILADEPLAALDLAHQLALIGHLKREAQSGKGVIIVLHDLALAMNHADRVVVLDQGQAVADDVPEKALAGEVIQRVWGVTAEWIGSEGHRALVTR
ncbi:ABC transporter ATP-binding protein [Pontixanthobacter aquaemixtae]|uniref:ATP-binding cassette domain-containing protein n=1 Tax=Pontixanthobacter aquaemixtae TaxID=1958940 RepID=A0A844ZRW9_9SPHN|nr:ABC transporter ATP-binding protein [Pontixanthobacter aquaemixtae]MXO90595.1 ATP-binding cassette domain-containing protein [Pontixanthobacter aquaemixtae]